MDTTTFEPVPTDKDVLLKFQPAKLLAVNATLAEMDCEAKDADVATKEALAHEELICSTCGYKLGT